MNPQNAPLRVCVSCEWIFKSDTVIEWTSCPKCGFGHYGARFVYGKKAYRYAVTQEPWMQRKLDAKKVDLLNEIGKTNPVKKEKYPEWGARF